MNTSSNKPAGRAKSCVVCRQFKLACDARKTHPNPCSRCVSKNTNCRFDPNFKRVSTRRITQEVANELHELRAALNAEGSSSNTPQSQLAGGRHSPPSLGGSQSVSSHDSSNQHTSSGTWLRLTEKELVVDQTLNGIKISSIRILKLFYHFERYYYPHARFLTPVTSINKLAQRCPLLFWTVLLLASERHEDNYDLYDHLLTAHDTFMSEILRISIQKLEVVHALMILCLWPIPKLRQAYDPGWSYVGLAIQGASHLNCHRPVEAGNPLARYTGSSDTVPADLDPVNQAVTWLSCYSIGLRLGAWLGLPPPIAMPQHAKSLKQAKILAANFLTLEEDAQFKMLDILCHAQTHLDAVEDLSTQYSMMQTYESQLEAIKTGFKERWSWNLELDYQSAKLYTLGVGLVQDISPDDQEVATYRQLILQKCLDAASSYITSLTNMSHQPASGSRYPSGILTFYPKYHFTSLMTCASYVYRYLISAQNINQAQQTLCVTRLTEAHKIFQSFPDHRDAVRGCITIEMFVNALRSGSKSNLATDVLVKNRLAASVVQDASFRAAEQRNIDNMNEPTLPTTEWLSMNDVMKYRLPLAPEQRIANTRDRQQQMSQDSWVADDSLAMGIWNDYANDFSVLSEPWIGSDTEFASLTAMPINSVNMGPQSTFQT